MVKARSMTALHVFSILLILLSATAAVAAEWVEYDLADVGSGGCVCASGRDGIAVAKATSNNLLFFNARSSTWTEHELGSPLSVVSTVADGYLAMVVGTDRAVVFNTLTSSVSELSYNGSLLSVSGDTRSFDCGYELALIVTDQEFCVFDAETDQWQRLSYTLPGALGFNHRHECHDTYAVSFLPLTNNTVVNLVYSLNQHAFNQTDMGLHHLAIPMNFGYAGFRNQYQAADYFLGYCSATNTFDRVDFVDGLTWAVASANINDAMGLRTATAGYYYEDFADDIRHYHVYGYDTRHGTWQHELFIVDRTEFSLANWRPGGTFCAVDNWDLEANQDNLLVFNGTSNSFYIHATDLDHGMNVVPGGCTLLALDDDRALGLAVDDPGPDHLDVDFNTYIRAFAGLGYVSFLSDETDDLVTANYYNATTRSWRQHTTGYHSSEGSGRPHVHVRVSGDPQREAIFYSTYRDEVYAYGTGSWSSVSKTVTDNYGIAYNSSAGVGMIYDAHRGTVYDWSDVNYLTLGDRILTLIDNTSAEARSYSTATGVWSTQALGADYITLGSRDLVTLIRHASLHRYYASFAGDDSWAYLEPYGSYATYSIGDRTALYVSSYFAYGLGVGEITPVMDSRLEVLPAPGVVEVRWESDMDFAEGELQLTATGPAGSGRQSWGVPLQREAVGCFCGRDVATELARGGTFTYTLEQVAERGNLVLDQRQVTLAALPGAAINRLCPNPFNPQLTVDFTLAAPEQVRLRVYDLSGRLVRVLADESLPRGRHERTWDGRDEAGRSVASGVYAIRLDWAERSQVRKAMLVR